ncbi:DUF934 domain-containing protein [Sphingomonas sp. MAH-20]|jgi:uncharacterized protein (DUF934 family)|uniref:DUF934 domain-containing protein n=1 Tax=Sphingomonas horti TaxID=2682842 RepID=A0A6I4J185_9SPHN|nr:MULTISPECIES: DUF934 domain-containing protein [Sphingomonas]MBA2918374.1 DUF934 domain-containing protein [Sphingomonas sp. CGMCC 1.13658]MVO77341.1 DUF934 domain-containing protein [Sphingomonas horti]
MTLRFRDDDPHEEPAVTLDCFLTQEDAHAVRVEAGEDVRQLIPHFDRLKLVEIAFPRFRDGRGYSAACILRESGYTGELRAEGDVLVDQILFLRRCGFDSFAPVQPLDARLVEHALKRFPFVYQAAADAAVPVWKLRHG